MFHGLHQSEGVPWFELHSVFREASTWEEMQRRFSLSWDTHMGPEAHRRWAHGLAPFCRAALGLPK